MRHFKLITKGIDVSGVLQELELHPELWNEHTVRREAPGTPHGGMSDIWVRYNDVAPYEAGEKPWSQFNDLHLPIFYRAWDLLPSLKEIVYELMWKLKGVFLGGILITKIPPGHEIKRHTDSSWHVDTFQKFYLSLKSAPGAQFGCQVEGEPFEILEPHAGDVWEFDNHKPHWVTNASKTDRITVVICIQRGA